MNFVPAIARLFFLVQGSSIQITCVCLATCAFSFQYQFRNSLARYLLQREHEKDKHNSPNTTKVLFNVTLTQSQSPFGQSMQHPVTAVQTEWWTGNLQSDERLRRVGVGRGPRWRFLIMISGYFTPQICSRRKSQVCPQRVNVARGEEKRHRQQLVSRSSIHTTWALSCVNAVGKA